MQACCCTLSAVTACTPAPANIHLALHTHTPASLTSATAHSTPAGANPVQHASMPLRPTSLIPIMLRTQAAAHIHTLHKPAPSLLCSQSLTLATVVTNCHCAVSSCRGQPSATCKHAAALNKPYSSHATHASSCTKTLNTSLHPVCFAANALP
jgi:hypothetical protein